MERVQTLLRRHLIKTSRHDAFRKSDFIIDSSFKVLMVVQDIDPIYSSRLMSFPKIVFETHEIY